eukprot:CAMPEP_0181498158 /NCGR_PEP_ID=MMETSP1110-20121109/53938_1 /TAXON_ID=174948 /ORGANISM="Symbiodinium sp., Strain CCMP421" /LENGTH=135 /DNA_ID=CAMNT_0023626183 /DNA_START=323 /DNA_END=730 /DNA_ORIENTATION=-
MLHGLLLHQVQRISRQMQEAILSCVRRQHPLKHQQRFAHAHQVELMALLLVKLGRPIFMLHVAVVAVLRGGALARHEVDAWALTKEWVPFAPATLLPRKGRIFGFASAWCNEGCSSISGTDATHAGGTQRTHVAS